MLDFLLVIFVYIQVLVIIKLFQIAKTLAEMNQGIKLIITKLYPNLESSSIEDK